MKICPPSTRKNICKNMKKCTFGPLPGKNNNGKRGSPICHLSVSEEKKYEKQQKCTTKLKRTSKKKRNTTKKTFYWF